LFSDRWLLRRQAGLVAFAAGAMLAAVFIDVLPEALHAFGTRALVWAFCGFVALALVEWLVGHPHQHEMRSPPRARCWRLC
jgi:zinc and cadmium transporter